MNYYRSPIEIIKRVEENYETAVEEGVFKVVTRLGFNVDKHELQKALAYDREQYQKGYKDGYAACEKEHLFGRQLMWSTKTDPETLVWHYIERDAEGKVTSEVTQVVYGGFEHAKRLDIAALTHDHRFTRLYSIPIGEEEEEQDDD